MQQRANHIYPMCWILHSYTTGIRLSISVNILLKPQSECMFHPHHKWFRLLSFSHTLSLYKSILRESVSYKNEHWIKKLCSSQLLQLRTVFSGERNGKQFLFSRTNLFVFSLRWFCKIFFLLLQIFTEKQISSKSLLFFLFSFWLCAVIITSKFVEK